MTEIKLNSVVARKKEMVAADMDGETVMLSIATGKYYNLGKTGGVIWGLLEQPIAVKDVIEQLVEKYAVSHQRCQEDVLTFLNQIQTEGLISIQ
ncbi:MAG: lasso peptide biosynthesis PqqD family chaperone [Acidaminococcaceae bacterium]